MSDYNFIGDYMLVIVLFIAQMVMLYVKSIYPELSWLIVLIPLWIAIVGFVVIVIMYYYLKG